MLAFWSHEGVVFLPSPHLITSSRYPCLGWTDAHWPHLGGPVPSPLKWRPFPQGLRTLPYRGPAQFWHRYPLLNDTPDCETPLTLGYPRFKDFWTTLAHIHTRLILYIHPQLMNTFVTLTSIPYSISGCRLMRSWCVLGFLDPVCRLLVWQGGGGVWFVYGSNFFFSSSVCSRKGAGGRRF